MFPLKNLARKGLRVDVNDRRREHFLLKSVGQYLSRYVADMDAPDTLF